MNIYLNVVWVINVLLCCVICWYQHCVYNYKLVHWYTHTYTHTQEGAPINTFSVCVCVSHLTVAWTQVRLTQTCVLSVLQKWLYLAIVEECKNTRCIDDQLDGTNLHSLGTVEVALTLQLLQTSAKIPDRGLRYRIIHACDKCTCIHKQKRLNILYVFMMIISRQIWHSSLCFKWMNLELHYI